MRRRNSDDEEGGLDSLLDTMTNVVGILILVLVVTQLGVGDAVKRITDSIKIDPQQLADAEKELQNRKQELESLLAAMADEEPVDASEYDQRLQELRQQIEQQQRVLEQLEAEKQARESELKEKMQLVEDRGNREQEINEARQQVEKLTGQWKTEDAELARLRALLAETPDRPVLPAKEVTLPDPRPAPDDATQLTIICSQNKVYLLPLAPDIELIRQAAKNRTLVVARKQYRTFKPGLGEGIDLFLKEFNERPLRDQFEYFDIELYNSNSNPRLMFIPRESNGEDERAVKGIRSRFQRMLQTVDPSLFYIRFYVCSDSFDIYVTTRRIVSEMGLLAGWDPQGPTWKYTTHLGGDLRFGPPPKPAPPPPPGVKPQPTKPPNVID